MWREDAHQLMQIYCVGRYLAYRDVDLGGRDDWRTKLSGFRAWR